MSDSFRENAFQYVERTRREFLLSSASGLGAVGLGSMLAADGLLGQASQGAEPGQPARR